MHIASWEWKLGLDVCCLILFSIPLILYNLVDIVPVTELGFFCDDMSIRYPYQNSTVPSTVNIVVAFITMLLMSSLVEIYLFLNNRRNKCENEDNNMELDVKVQNHHPILIEQYRSIGYFVIGAAATQFLTDMLKYKVGRLRPHFFQLCLPNVTCTPQNGVIYQQDFQCTRQSHPLISMQKFSKALDESRLSFPSGHCSLVTFAFVYISIYLEFRLRSDKRIRTIRHTFQLGFIAWAFFVCSSRFTDYKHHTSDILAGMLLGALVASLATYFYTWSYTSSHMKITRRTKEPNLAQRPEEELTNRRSEIAVSQNQSGAL